MDIKITIKRNGELMVEEFEEVEATEEAIFLMKSRLAEPKKEVKKEKEIDDEWTAL